MGWTVAQRRLLFRYDATLPLDVLSGTRTHDNGLLIERLTFASAHDQRVPAVLYRRADAERPPVVIVGHGAGGSKDDPLMDRLFRWLAEHGLAVAAIDAPCHGERYERFEDFRDLLRQPFRGLHFVVQAVVDTMRAVDWLHTRDDLDAARIGYLGLSMGTILGVPFVGIDTRISAAVFALGGAGVLHFLAGLAAPEVRSAAERVAEALDPMHYAPLIAPRPVLMVNGTRDEIMPPAVGHLLYGLLGEPKRIIWYEGGHGDVPPEVVGEVRAFFAETLGAA